MKKKHKKVLFFGCEKCMHRAFCNDRRLAELEYDILDIICIKKENEEKIIKEFKKRLLTTNTIVDAQVIKNKYFKRAFSLTEEEKGRFKEELGEWVTEGVKC